MDIAQTPNQRKRSDEPVNLILPPHNTMVGSSNASDKHIAAFKTWATASLYWSPGLSTALSFRFPTGHDRDQSPTTYVA